MKKLKRKIKKRIKFLLKKNSFTRKIYQKIFYLKHRIRYMLKYYNRRDIHEKTIFFESFMGKSFADSPKAIYLELLKDPRFKDFRFVWAFKKPKRFINEPLLQDAIIVRRNSAMYYQFLATSKYWVSNSRMHYFLTKHHEQVYIQTWHGTPFKRIGFDIEKGDNANHSFEGLRKRYKFESDLFDYILSPSEFCSAKLASAFDIEKPDEKVLEVGYPRNDYLKNHTADDVLRIKENLEIPKGKKVILYAPTWRDNQHDGNGYRFTPPLDFTRLSNTLGDDYLILVRFHYFVANQIDFSLLPENVINVSSYSDINELYIVSDMLITDYSSVFFDYALLGRPIAFFMYDLEEYMNKLRGFYFSLDKLPGPIIKDENELILSIVNIFNHPEKAIETTRAFSHEFSYLDDGNASKRVIEQVFQPKKAVAVETH